MLSEFSFEILLANTSQLEFRKNDLRRILAWTLSRNFDMQNGPFCAFCRTASTVLRGDFFFAGCQSKSPRPFGFYGKLFKVRITVVWSAKPSEVQRSSQVYSEGLALRSRAIPRRLTTQNRDKHARNSSIIRKR